MNALWAIVVDTWRQSRQQAVFIVMLGLLGLLAILAIVLPQPFEQDDGTTRIGFVVSDGPSMFLEEGWTQVYAQSLLMSDPSYNPMDIEALDANEARMQAAYDAVEARDDTPLDRRAVEMLLFGFGSSVFTISMLLFIAACSGYFPNMLEAGAIDVVLARPVSRARIYLGKFLGGLALYTAAIAATYIIIFIGVGFRTGVWVPRLFLLMPLQVFSAAVLFAILAALGVVSRSSTLCLIVGFVFYILIDTAIGGLLSVQRFGIFGDATWVDTLAEVLRWTMPNFGLLKENATASVLNMPLMQWQPFFVAAAWLGGMLGFGIWRFSRADY